MKPKPAPEERPAPQPLRQQSPRQHESRSDVLLDEALEDTFPASDPVAITQPTKRSTRRRLH